MRRLDRGYALALAAAIALCVGCKKRMAPEMADAGATASGGGVPSGQVLARVGDRTVTVGDFVAALEHMDQFDRMRYQAPERRQELLGEMIDVMLLADEAREKGYDKDPIAQQEFREILRDAMLKKAREGAPTPSTIPEVEVRAYYEAHRDDFHDPERRRVSVIVLSASGTANAVLEAAKKATALQWGELVRTKSVDAQAKGNTPADLAGDFGFVGPPGDPRGANPRVPDEVRTAVFEIANAGEVLPRPVAARGMYYVVKWTHKTEPQDRTFEDAQRAIRVKLAQDRIRAREEALLDDLRGQYPVQIDEAALGEVKVDLPAADGGN
jgi:hypothetical protein